MRSPVGTGVGRYSLARLLQGPKSQASIGQHCSLAREVACLRHDRTRVGRVRLARQKIQLDTVHGVAKEKCRR